jgi:phytoene dehydrogenase-like protein
VSTPSQQREKVLIIGSGIGGLSMAIILSKLGFNVTVIEKNRHPGGMLRSYVRRGVHCHVGLHYLGALGEGQVLRRLFDYLGITADLPLEPMGVGAPVDRYYFTGNGDSPWQFDMPAGLDAYEAQLKQTFPQEIIAIEGFIALLRQGAMDLDRLAFLSETVAVADLIDQTRPLWDELDRLGCSPGLKSVLSIPSVWFGVPPDQCPVFLHTMTLASYLASAWRLKTNGMQMVEMLEQRLTDLGADIICGHAVERINVNHRQVTGLTLKNGEQYHAPRVIGAVHPCAVLDLLGEDNVKPSYRRRIKELINTKGMFGVHTLLPASTRSPVAHNAFSISTDTAGRVHDVIYAQLRPSGRPGSLLLSLITKGYESLWQPWANTSSGARGADYQALKLELAHGLVKNIEGILGPIKEHEIIDTYTPLTIRDWVNSPHGSAYGVMRSHTQMLSAALLNRTKIKGLFLAGQSVMAPGVLGVILGSLVTTKLMIGPERFSREVRLS